MAADDIYLLRANFESPSRHASYGLYYQQTVINDVVNGHGPRVLGVTWIFQMASLVIAMLSDDWWFASVDVQQVHSETGILGEEPSWNEPSAVQVGLRTGPSLPANDAALCGLLQATFTARHNGRIFVPGIAEGDTTVGNLDNAFLSGVFSAFRQGLIDTLEEEGGGTGRWKVGVINRTVLNAAPPAKDYAGAFATATAATVTPIIASQRVRTTRVRGAAL